MNKEKAANPGLEGVIAAETVLSSVDGDKGELIIAGWWVEELAPRFTFEETLFLLWNGRLPSAAELAETRASLGKKRALPPLVQAVVKEAARAESPASSMAITGATGVAPLARSSDRAESPASSMSILRTAISALSAGGETDELSIVGAFPTVIAAIARHRRGEAPIDPDPTLSHAADFLRMLSGKAPEPAFVRAIDTYLNTTIDHGLNASTFVARAIISTQSDLVSAVTGAIGALKGPLHGGAPGPVLDLLQEAVASNDVAALLRAKLAQGERLMGFGHRIYRVRDPRADVLAGACEALRGSMSGEGARFFEAALAVEQTALRVLKEHKPDRPLHTNVELYTALLLNAAGVPKELFSTLFAMSRVAGWIAHAKEQLATKKLIRPQSLYVGPAAATSAKASSTT